MHCFALGFFFGFLAGLFFGLVIGYLPVLYQSYSNRELRIAVLDARAGSPPSAGALLMRQGRNPRTLERELGAWEEWSAQLLQHHVSYPMLSYFRSQHVNQSWLAGITTILDVSAVVMLSGSGDLKRQAEITFAMGRHTLVDVARIIRTHAPEGGEDRLPSGCFEQLRTAIVEGETALDARRLQPAELASLRRQYEPYAEALSRYFLIALPRWLPPKGRMDNWNATDWDRSAHVFAVSDPFTETEE